MLHYFYFSAFFYYISGTYICVCQVNDSNTMGLRVVNDKTKPGTFLYSIVLVDFIYTRFSGWYILLSGFFCHLFHQHNTNVKTLCRCYNGHWRHHCQLVRRYLSGQIYHLSHFIVEASSLVALEDDTPPVEKSQILDSNNFIISPRTWCCTPCMSNLLLFFIQWMMHATFMLYSCRLSCQCKYLKMMQARVGKSTNH